MRRAIQDATACREALARLPELDLGELRQQWRALYKSDASNASSANLPGGSKRTERGGYVLVPS